ncbi:MAG: hypothetical protein LC772_11535, partial [Chloroflexi bacterium]|nr:hypothetical protein [Chloroflexota bacterium]
PFDERELLALYVLLTTGALIMGFGAAHFLLPYVITPRYFATPANHWEKQLFPLLPRALFIPGTELAKDFYVGRRTGVPWHLWAVPLALWTIYIMLMCLVMLGVNGLVRRFWIHHERLTFPQVYLPLEVARQETGCFLNSFFRSRAMWAGFLVAAALETTAGVHQYFPSTPTIQFRGLDPLQSMTGSPWNSVTGFVINVYPCIIGLTFLLTTEVSWSTWFFYLVRKFLPILGVQFGWQDAATQDSTRFPFPDQVSTGAFLAVGLFSLYGAVRIWLSLRERGESLAIPLREFGAVGIGVVLLIAWTRLLSMSLLVTLGFLAAFALASLAYTRVRAETGLGGLTGPMPVQDALIEGAGSMALSRQDLAGLTDLRWSSWDMRFMPSEMPAQLEGYKIGSASGIPDRFLFWALLLSVLIGLIISYGIELPIIYHYGANQMNVMRYQQIPRESFNLLSRWTSSPKPADSLGLSAGCMGFIITAGLTVLRARFFPFPFHPLGFAIGFSRRTIDWLWFSIFVGWACKSLTLRAGGLEAYRKLLPFFLGLLLGDFCLGGIFGLLGCLYPAAAGYSVYP